MCLLYEIATTHVIGEFRGAEEGDAVWRAVHRDSNAGELRQPTRDPAPDGLHQPRVCVRGPASRRALRGLAAVSSGPRRLDADPHATARPPPPWLIHDAPSLLL